MTPRRSTWSGWTYAYSAYSTHQAGDAKAQYLEWMDDLMQQGDEEQKVWHNRLHYGDQVKLDKRQDHLENARSQPAAQAKGQADVPASDRCVPLP